MSTLNSKIILCNNIKLDKNYANVLSYSESNMLDLCSNNAVASANNYSFIRESGALLVEIPYGTCLQCNYMAYQNTDYSGKWFFAFIDKVEYVSEKTTRILYTVDSWSTWYSYWNLNSVFVHKEHVSDDTPGLHTLPENVDTGEYVSVGSVESVASRDYFICVCATKDPSGVTSDTPGIIVNGLYNGLGYYLSRGNDHGGGTGQASIKTNTNLLIYKYGVTEGLSQDDIVSVFLVPRGIIDETKINWESMQTDPGTIAFDVGRVDDNFSAGILERYLIEKPTTLDGNYTPKNKKLLCWPFRYMLADNNAGMTVIYRYEDFAVDPESPRFINFKSYGAISPGCAIRCVPQRYKGKTENFTESINYGKFPVCAWTKDTYLNWMTQMGINNQADAGAGILKIAASPLLGKLSGVEAGSDSFFNGAEDIFNAWEEERLQEFAPNQAMGNTNNGDVNFPLGLTNITFTHMSIKNEYAVILDQLFNRFGYTVRAIKTPNITGRPYWNFVKTGAEEKTVYGSIPQMYIDQINNAFSRGVTIWHNHANIGNFSLDNSI